MRKWLCTLACAPFAVYAYDVHTEIGVGINQYAPQSDGIWYQLGMPHKLGLQGRAYMIGLTGSIWREDPYGIDWHTDYVNLGHIRSTCWCTPLDANYDVRTHALIPHPAPVPNAQYTGAGSVQGVKFMAEGYRTLGDWKIGMDAGLFPYRPQWRESVYGWAMSYDVPRRNGVHATPYTWQLGKMVGLTLSKGRMSISYAHFVLPTRFDSTHDPALWVASDAIFITWRL
jgi:hypothetical protein